MRVREMRSHQSLTASRPDLQLQITILLKKVAKGDSRRSSFLEPNLEMDGLGMGKGVSIYLEQ